MKHVLKSPVFWILFTLFSASCIFTTIKLSSRAFPIVHINLKLDRDGALSRARDLASKLSLGPAQYSQAASFDTDMYVKTFVELEGGGKDALIKLIDDGLYQPYSWHVRHFSPMHVHETSLQFTPDGIPFGFYELISEETKLPNMSPDEARSLAEKSAISEWNLDLDKYGLVETSKHENPNQRIDHTFVYERKSERIGAATYRVRLIVSGNHFTELTHFVKVPDEFGRRYAQMRAANDRIAWIAQIVILIFYIIGCGIVGLFFLIKQRWLLWRGPLLLATIISLLNTLSRLNSIPQLWIRYRTAVEPVGFIVNFLISTAYQFGFMLVSFGIIFLAAEGLTRKAFPHHLQLSTVWSLRNASSLPVFGQTFCGYLVTPVMLAFGAIFYIVTAKYFHWWIPSEALIDPNILATYAPWLEPVSRALSAGVVEECLFRAIPLASAALLGNRFGHRKYFITAAFILQAIIFGAAHANYPMQPAYARLIELLVPSFVFGGLYLAFGLLPAIINHFAFDVVLMSVPVFLSSGISIYINQIVVIIVSLIPVWIILIARFRQQSFTDKNKLEYNRSFVPNLKNSESEPKKFTLIISSIPRHQRTVIYLLGLAGLVALIGFGKFQSDTPKMELKRPEAIEIAQKYLKERGVELSDSWRALPSVNSFGFNDMAHNFVWREGGAERYHKLLRTYLTPPHWHVRFAKFEGPVEERAEEYHVAIDSAGKPFRLSHELPEAMIGATLSEEEARTLAHATLQKEFSVNPKEVVEISAFPHKLIARTDWNFVYTDPNEYSLPKGRAEIYITIAGSNVVDWSKGIHVPEEWYRAEQNNLNRAFIITQICLFPIYGVLLFGLILGFIRLVFQPRFRKIFAICFVSIGIIFVANSINVVPFKISWFATTKSFSEQLIMALGGSTLFSIMKAGVLGLIIVYIITFRRNSAINKTISNSAVGVGIGIFLVGVESFILWIIPVHGPTLAHLDVMDSYVSAISELCSYGFQYLQFTSFIMLLLLAAQRSSSSAILWASVIFLSGFMISGPVYASNIPLFLSIGLARALVLVAAWRFVVRFDYSLFPLIVSTYYAFVILQQGLFGAYSYALLDAMIVSVVIASVGTIMFFRPQSGT